MKHTIRVGIMFKFQIDLDQKAEMEPKSFLMYLINRHIREVIENHLPSGWLMKVMHTEVDGKKIENRYE